MRSFHFQPIHKVLDESGCLQTCDIRKYMATQSWAWQLGHIDPATRPPIPQFQQVTVPFSPRRKFSVTVLLRACTQSSDINLKTCD